MNFLTTFLNILLVAAIPLVLYALSKCGRDFDVLSWILHSRSRLVLGFALILLFSAVLVFVPEARDVIAAVGFNAEKPSALGLAIGGLLVAGIRGDEE